MEVTARLAEQSAECSVALCQMLGTPLLQQHSSSSPPPPHHHHINSIPSPSSPSTVHSQTHQPTWPLVVSLPAAASSARPPAAPVLLNLLPTQLSFSRCLILRTLTHTGGVELGKKINVKKVTQLGVPSFFSILCCSSDEEEAASYSRTIDQDIE